LGYEINLNKEIIKSLTSNSNDLTFFNNFDKSENVVSIIEGLKLNTTIPECSFGGNSFLLRKCSSNVNITLDSDFAILDSCLSVKPDGIFLISYPCSLNNSLIFSGKFHTFLQNLPDSCSFENKSSSTC